MNAKKCKRIRQRLRTYVKESNLKFQQVHYLDKNDNKVVRQTYKAPQKQSTKKWVPKVPEQTIGVYPCDGPMRVNTTSIRGLYKVLKKQFRDIPVAAKIKIVDKNASPFLPT